MSLRSRGRLAKRPAHRRPTPRRLGSHLESLEPRCLLASVALDPSFGVGGLVTTDIGTARDASAANSHDYVGEALRLPDGKLLLAGTSNLSAHDFALLRYNADGTLDTDFGDQGVVVTDFAGTSDWGRSIALQDDGKIVVAGHASRNWNFDFGVARYNPDGSLDTDFDGDGIAFASISGTELRVGEVVLQGDGKIVIAGTSQEGAGNYTESVALARLNADGSLDGSFGVAGTVFEPVSGVSQSAKSMILQSDGKLVVSGSRKDDAGTVAYLARYNGDGSPDESFAGTGQVLTSPHGDGRNVLLQPDGKLLQVSWSNTGLSMARYRSDGTPDSSFGVDGLRVHFGLGMARAATLQGDGKILVSLVNHNVDPATSKVERFHADGSLDAEFHEAIKGGPSLDFNGTDHSLVLSEDGKLLVAGGAFNPSTGGSSGINDPFNGFHYDIVLAQYTLDSAPSFSLSEEYQQVDEDAGPQTIVRFATDILPGINGGPVTFEIVSNSNPDLFAQQPAISSSGTFSYQPAADAWGKAALVVRAFNEAGEASAEQNLRIIVDPINDAPVLDATVLRWLPKVQQADANPPCSDLSSLLVGVLDADAGDSLGIALTKADSIFGNWEVQLPGDTAWQRLGEVSETSARLLPSNAQLRLVPQHEVSRLHTLEYRVWDQTEGVAGDSVDLTGKTGGSHAFSAAQGIAALHVFKPRPADRPQPPEFFTARIATVTEHGPAMLLAPDMVMTDADSTSYGPNAMLTFNVDYQRLAVGLRHTGTGPGQIGNQNGSVSYGGQALGTARTSSYGDMDVFLYEGATVEAIQALLRNVTVKANGDEVATGLGSVTVQFTEDRTIHLASESVFSHTPILVNRIGLNDTPALTVTTGGGSYVAGDAPLPLVSELSLSDPDAYHGEFFNSTVTVSITENGEAADRLSLLDGSVVRVVDSQLFRGERLVGMVSGGVNGQPLVVQFKEAFWTEVIDVLKHLAFSTAANADASEPRQIRILFADGAGAEAEPALLSVTVIPPTAPVLDTTLSPTFRPVREDALNSTSTRVTELLDGAFTDPQQDSLRGVAITSASNYHGVWQYRLGDHAQWQAVGSVSERAALLIPGWARLRFIPKTDFNGTVKMYYRAWDQTQGAPGERFNLVGKTGGANAFSVAKEGASLTVTPVNDPPKLSLSGTIGYQRDASAITLAPFATVADVDSANFYSGRLRVWITDGASSSNRLILGSGFSVDANNNVLEGSTIIGKRTSSGFGARDLIITFNNKATPAITQRLVRAIAFKTVDGAAGQRTILFTLSDGDGGLSDVAMKKINVT